MTERKLIIGDHPRKDERTEALYDERTVPVPRYIIDHILACYFADPEIEADVETMCDLGRLVGFTLPPEFEDDEGRPTS